MLLSYVTPAVFACVFLFGHPAGQRNSPVAVPVRIASGLVYMQGRINSSGPLGVVLDTGSSVSVVSPSVALTAGLTSSRTAEAAGMGSGANETLHLFDDGDLEWGSGPDMLRLPHQRGAILPIDYISEQVGEPTDAIFGSNLFLHYTVRVDYERQRVTFFPADSDAQPSGVPIAIQILGDVPFAQATVRGEDGQEISGLFFLDSGTTGAMLLNKKFLNAHPGLIAKGHFAETPSATAVGGKIDVSRVKVPQVRIGSFVFSGVVAGVPERSAGALANESLAGVIGAGILSRFTVTWDYARKHMFLVPGNTINDPFETDCSGVHLIAHGGDYKTITMDVVLPGSPAAMAGLRPGDQIVAIDGVHELPLWKISEALRKDGTSISLTIRRESKVFKVEVVLRSPFQWLK